MQKERSMKLLRKYMEDLADVPKTVKSDVKNALMNPQISCGDIYYPKMSVAHERHLVLKTLDLLSPEWEDRATEYMRAAKIFGTSRDPKKAAKEASEIAISFIHNYASKTQLDRMRKMDGGKAGNKNSLSRVVYLNMLIIQVFSRIYELAKFNVHGRRVMKITDRELKERLSNTDFKNIRMSHLDIPFESFYIDVGIREKAVYDDISTRGKYHGYPEKVFNGKIEIGLEGIIISRYLDGYGFICIHDTSIRGDIVGEHGRNVRKMEENVAFPIACYVSKTGDDMEKIATHLRYLSTNIFPRSPEFADVSERVFKKGISMALNTIIYASHVNKQRKEKLVEEKPPSGNFYAAPFPASRKAAKKNSGKYYYTFLKASSESKKAWKRENEKASESKRNGGKPFLVRGHWRNQPYGSRENPEYKLKWIEPYWKNLAPEKEKNVAEPDSEEKYRIYTMR